ncbi:MAG TPA: porin family protein [Salegentibacter sp.]|nr:porin family protein [Salegentibacter sp.]
MKKLFITGLLIISGFNLIAQENASSFSFGLKAGVNLANIYSSNLPIEEFTKNKFGIHGGAMAEYRFSELFALQAELLYSEQGTKSDIDYIPIDPPGEIGTFQNTSAQDNSGNGLYENLNSTGNYNYLNLPLLAKLYVYKGLNVFAGPQFSVLLSAKDELPNGQEMDVKDQLDAVDFGLNGGLGYQTDFGAFVSANYYLGLNNISYYNYEDYLGFDINLHQGVWQFSVGYKF